MSNFYCVPLRMFTEDTKQVFRKAKNKIVKDCPVAYQNKVTLWESFVMKLCALWELEATDDIYCNKGHQSQYSTHMTFNDMGFTHIQEILYFDNS